MPKQITFKRKRGNVVRLFVEIDAGQARRLDNVLTRINKSKTDAIQEAINLWLSYLEPIDRREDSQ